MKGEHTTLGSPDELELLPSALDVELARSIARSSLGARGLPPFDIVRPSFLRRIDVVGTRQRS